MIKAVKTAVPVLAVAALLYAFAPSAMNPFTRVSEQAERNGVGDFSLPALDGSRWSLSEHRGEVILLNFWATWCPPCRAETPALVEVHNELSGRGFAVVGVSLDEDPRTVVPGFVSQFRVSYPILIPTADFPLAGRVQTLPTSLLIDKKGRIARTYLGIIPESILRRDVERLLGESE